MQSITAVAGDVLKNSQTSAWCVADNVRMTELILIRHGETDWNRELRFQGQVDVPLNEAGRTQARHVADRLGSEPIDQLYSSDLLRTRQTAQPLAMRSGRQVTELAGLREQNFGRIDGMRVADIQAQHPADWTNWLRFDADHAFDGGGESTRNFYLRVQATLLQLVLAHPDQTLGVITHGGVLDMIRRGALGRSLSGPRDGLVPNGAISRVRLANHGRVEILQWADARHLDGLPAQPVYQQPRPLPVLLPQLRVA